MADEIDYGQAEIQAFNNAAAAGEIHYDEAAVRQAVQLYQNVIDRLLAIQGKLEGVYEAQGFGRFQTGKDLQRGFSGKARDGYSVVTQLIDGAMRLQEAYLRAGRLIDEADAINSARIKRISGLASPKG
ncbi:hypothetical protein ACFYU5_04590 [Nocardia aobensis]|uniref:Uncharacterized protein n=1 Tax=Nocardia aobensis TaxID=257277 RepID=A0ABW6NZ67_9NOCA